MGDMKEVFNDMKQDKKERHAKWYEANMKIIRDSGFIFIEHPTALLFRDKVNADFYPHTGRWKIKNKMYSGGAVKFLKLFNGD